MTIAAYADLKTKVASWLRRAGNTTFVAEVPDIITFGEGRLNTELGAIETNVTLTGSVGSRSLDLTALTIVEPIALWLTPGTSQNETRLDVQSPELMSYAAANGEPRGWAYDSEDAIKLDRPCDAAYSFRFRYRGRFALSAASTSNWLLENRPDIYLAASLMWGAGYLQSWPNAAVWQNLLDRDLPKVAHALARGRRGTLALDPVLAIGGRSGYNITYDR